jgi:DNA-binding transcriptional LysR family regulator
MELRQLRYLVTVADEGSFTRAAQRLHVAQPGVSAQIKELEREIGELLLDRAGRTVRLTQAGAAVLPYARAALDAVEGAHQAVSELTGLIQGHVTVGTVASVAAADLPGLLASFHQRYPGVRITLAEGTSSQLLAGLRTGRLDLILIGAIPEAAAQVIADEALAAVVPVGDPLAARDHLAAAELRDRPLICLPPGSGLRACLEEACAEAGFRPYVAFESTDPRMLMQLAAAGLGIAVLSQSGARSRAGNLRMLRLSGTTARARLLLAWRDDAATSPAARALIAHARAAVSGEPDGLGEQVALLVPVVADKAENDVPRADGGVGAQPFGNGGGRSG